MTRGLLPFLALLAACGTTTEFVRTNSSYAARPARPADAVDIYTAGPPPRPFVEVGIIEAQQQSAYSSGGMPRVIAELRKRAGAEGCDGVILLGANDKVVGSSYMTGSTYQGTGSVLGSGSTTTLKGYRGTCIAYTE
jgi:hypothetical protein